jgi:hypothetical protein
LPYDAEAAEERAEAAENSWKRTHGLLPPARVVQYGWEQEVIVPDPARTPGRNDPCHCGSGKKYKNCCLDKDEAKARKARTQAEAAAGKEEAGAADAPKTPPPPPKHTTRQPWKGAQTPRGFQRMNIPRRSGGS